MALQKQQFPIPFSGGVDTKTDKKQTMAGKLLALANGVFKKTGELAKRYGYTALAAPGASGGLSGSAVGLSTFEDELLCFTGQQLYSYAPSGSAAATPPNNYAKWSARGGFSSVRIKESQIVRTSAAQQLNPDVAVGGGLEVYAWEDSRAGGSIWYEILDATTGAVMASPTQIASGATKPKLVWFNGQIHLFYLLASTGGLQHATVTPGSTAPAFSAPTLATTLTAAGSYDLCTDGSFIYIGAVETSTPSVSVRVFFASVIATTTLATGTTAYNGGPAVVGIACDAATTAVWIAWGTGAEIRIAGTASGTSIFKASTQVEAVAVDTISMIVYPGAASAAVSTVQLFYEQHAAAVGNHLIKSQVESAASVTAGSVLFRGCGLASKPWFWPLTAQQGVCFAFAVQSSLQSTYFVGAILGSASTIAARIQPGTGGGLRSNGQVSESVVTPDGAQLFANGGKGRVLSEANTVFSLVGVNGTRQYFTLTPPVAVEQSRNLLIAGGVLQNYDGTTVTEHGFHLYPEGVSGVLTGSGGSIDAGDHQWSVVYQWTDSFGQVHRSAPSVPLLKTTVANDKITLTIPTLRLTAKTNVEIVIYRTAAAGTSFNRVTSVLAPLMNDPTVDSVTFVDSISDASAAANEFLYTTGGVVANIAPPASSAVARFQGRVFVAGLEDPNLLWFSKNKYDNTNANTVPVEFSDALSVGVDSYGGPITAIFALDGNLLIFKRDAIFALTGDGPTDTGQGPYADPQLLTSDAGCINQLSIVAFPNGVLFQSAKGIYQIDRSLQCSYIGAPVEDLVLTITGAALLSESNQVVFSQTTGSFDAPSLVYDYFFGQWSTWTGQDALSSVAYESKHVALTTTGNVFFQDIGNYSDAGTYIPLLFETPNLKFAQLGGWQRVFSVAIVGTYKADHQLQVDVAYDDEVAFTATTGTWVPASAEGYAYRVDFKRQLASAIRLRVSDSQHSSPTEGYSVSALNFTAGVLPGTRRVPALQTKGAA